MGKQKPSFSRGDSSGGFNDFLQKIHNGPVIRYGLAIALFLLLALWLFNVAFRGYVPQASDTIHWKGSSEMIREYNATHKDQALWTPSLFSGMPSYMIAFPPKYPFINELRDVISHVVNWRVFVLFMAGLGVYLLLLMLGFEPLVAFIGAAGFALSCHFFGLLQIGHNTKFRAIAYIPWVYLAWLYLKEKRDLLGLGLLAVFLIGQMRENHPQIVYYTFILLGITWIYQLVLAIRDDELKPYITFSLMALAALVITALAVMNPYASIREYAEYTIRGGEGLTTAYAQSWSFHPLEMLTFIVPDWFGGTDAMYWGWMPGQGASMYMGVIILMLALTGVIGEWKRQPLVRILAIVSVVALLIAFGRHFNVLSKLLLAYLPMFDKFRVPTMTLVLVEFAIVVLAAFGARFILDEAGNEESKLAKVFKIALISLPGLVIVLFVGRAIAMSSGMMHANDAARYAQYPQYLDKLKALRLDALTGDLVRACVLMAAFIASTWAVLARKLNRYAWLWLIVVLVVLDLLIVDGRFLRPASNDNPNGLVAESELDTQQFRQTKVDEYLLADKTQYRILPMANSERDVERRNWQWESNRWAFNHQSIWGYHPSKLMRYNEILDNCMRQPTVHWFPFNMNVVNMLNTKYVVHPALPRGYFRGLAWRNSNLPLYENLGALPRAWFVDSTFVAADKQQIFDSLNSRDFDPATTAILESPLTGLAAPDSAGVTVDDAAFDPHHAAFDAHTDQQALLVVSEVYYPAGWHAYIDGEEAPIVPVNYILRGVVVPPGAHRVEMVFAPSTYATSIRLSLIGLLATVLVTLVGAVFWIRRNFRGENVYVIK